MDFGDTLHKGDQTQRDTTCVAKGQGWWGMGSETVHGDEEVLEVNGGDNCMTVGKHFMYGMAHLNVSVVFIVVIST